MRLIVTAFLMLSMKFIRRQKIPQTTSKWMENRLNIDFDRGSNLIQFSARLRPSLMAIQIFNLLDVKNPTIILNFICWANGFWWNLPSFVVVGDWGLLKISLRDFDLRFRVHCGNVNSSNEMVHSINLCTLPLDTWWSLSQNESFFLSFFDVSTDFSSHPSRHKKSFAIMETFFLKIHEKKLS